MHSLQVQQRFWSRSHKTMSSVRIVNRDIPFLNSILNNNGSMMQRKISLLFFTFCVNQETSLLGNMNQYLTTVTNSLTWRKKKCLSFLDLVYVYYAWDHKNVPFLHIFKLDIAQSAGAVEYIYCFSAEG